MQIDKNKKNKTINLSLLVLGGREIDLEPNDHGIVISVAPMHLRSPWASCNF